MASVNLVIVIIVGAIIGALVGKVLGTSVDDFYLAVIAGILATLVAGVVRNTILTRAGYEPERPGTPQLMLIYDAVAIDHRIPLRVIAYAVVASLAGSAAAVEIADLNGLHSQVMLGMLAGLFSGVLMAIIMLVYDLALPGRNPKRE